MSICARKPLSRSLVKKSSNITGTKFTLCRNSQKALIAQRLRTASPATLRQQAAISRELGPNVQLFVATDEARESQKPGPKLLNHPAHSMRLARSLINARRLLCVPGRPVQDLTEETSLQWNA
jgi:hypothetical protein